MKYFQGKKTYIVAAVLMFLNSILENPTVAAEIPAFVQVISHEFIIMMMVILRAITGDTITPEIKQDLLDYKELKRQIFNLNQQKGN